MVKAAELRGDKLISKVQNMFEETASIINETCQRTTSEITEHIDTLSDENSQLDEIINTFNKKR